ncbi:hypothetical protein VE03_06347 [Pseudogymnoascus sp. 23342-1-I1]|nr:hypothetical protein VE03_06347 [Pseudogymnoascus sp. 23342-1-I1]
MRTFALLAAVAAVGVGAAPEDGPQIVIGGGQHASAKEGKKLTGRFLHITDLHPDPYYKPHTSLTTCHRTPGPSLPYGTPLSDCDSPATLVNATLSWISAHLPAIDFVIWTGDSARHDRDELIPRTAAEIADTNTQLADAFRAAFADKGVPVVPTLGNNDITPHNILLGGPNKWLQTYGRIWHHFIPEAQRHGFQRGGWFTVDVIPGRLAVVSLNTLYFFERNSGVDGCAERSEPGWEQMEWLGIQLGFMRDRGVKAILMGHVPPARTGGKRLWDESCWGRYVVWVERYRDVVVGGAWGHMNIDHFLLQKGGRGVKALMGTEGRGGVEGWAIGEMGGEVAVKSVDEYLQELRDGFARVPDPREAVEGEVRTEGKKERRRRKKVLKRMGGEWAERYQVSLVSPSVVPNYFPSLRVVEYNVSGLDGGVVAGVGERATATSWRLPGEDDEEDEEFDEEDTDDEDFDSEDEASDDEEDYEEEASKTKGKKHKKKKKKKHGKPKHPDLKIPPPPPAGSPPGPAYSPQPLSWTGYTQYFANLTAIAEAEAEAAAVDADDSDDVDVSDDKGKKGKGGKGGKDKPKPNPGGGEFKYEIEYTTFNDSKGFALPDLTVRSFLGLAHRIGRAKGGISGFGLDGAEADDGVDEVDEDEGEKDVGLLDRAWEYMSRSDGGEEVDAEGKKKKKDGKKHKKRERAWKVFVNRAFVGTGAEEGMGSNRASEVGEGERGDRGGEL